eukprot:XP_015583988.1 uncharacterized protein LOC107262485 [Ricinus communis]
MVLLVAKISKLYSKLENHHHHHRGRPQSEAFSASLQAFRSDVSSSITRLLLNSKPGGLEIMSLEWIQECFQVLPFINKAFAKLVVEIDYHMSEWKAKSMEAYLKYSLDLLDLLNSISSSLSYLGQIRLALSHALSLVESSPSSGIEHSSDAAEELRRKMEVFEKMLDGLGKEVNLFFSEVLAWRNELLDGIRFRK